jgi:lysophospholipase L1-like esterase
MKIVTIVSDSLGMVRPNEGRTEDDIYYRDLYSYKLQESLGGNYCVVHHGIRGLTTNDLNSEQYIHDYIQNSESEYAVLHIGICDCAPRLIRNSERLALKVFDKLGLRFLSKYYIKFKSKNRLFFTKKFPYQYVNPERYYNNLRSLIRKSINIGVKKVIVINIINTSDDNNNRNYNFRKNIRLYNEIINKVVNENPEKVCLIDLYNESVQSLHEYILEDGIHITTKAHDLIAQKIYKEICC